MSQHLPASVGHNRYDTAGTQRDQPDVAVMNSECAAASSVDTTVAAPDAADAPVCPVARESSRFIPYITPLKGEGPVTPKVVLRPDGLGVMFPDETADDRDRRGALWLRTGAPSPGRVIPMFRKVHPRRAGEVMLDMRCQGCNGEPHRTREGILFFSKPETRRRNLNWPDVVYTCHPPVCLPCAQQAMFACPFVLEAPALRVRQARPWGIDGFYFRPDANGTPRLDEGVDRCAYEDLKLLPWMVAIQPIARLSRCTVVDIRAELAAAGLNVPASGDGTPTGRGSHRTSAQGER